MFKIPPLYTCRLCKSFLNLEKDSFNYGFDKRDGTTFLLCNSCKNGLDKVAEEKISEEEFRKSVRKRWEEGERKVKQKNEEYKKQGLKVEITTFGGKPPETISCCQLVEWFNNLEEEKKKSQHQSFLEILNNLEKKGKLCSDCVRFCDKLKNG